MSDEATLTARPEEASLAQTIGSSLAHVTVSGLYATAGLIPSLIDDIGLAGDGHDTASPLSSLPIQPIFGEELRLDVDGRYPQMAASGTIPISKVQRLQWIASLKKTGAHSYAGGIWYKDPATAPFPYTTVSITVLSIAWSVIRPAPCCGSRSGQVSPPDACRPWRCG